MFIFISCLRLSVLAALEQPTLNFSEQRAYGTEVMPTTQHTSDKALFQSFSKFKTKFENKPLSSEVTFDGVPLKRCTGTECITGVNKSDLLSQKHSNEPALLKSSQFEHFMTNQLILNAIAGEITPKNLMVEDKVNSGVFYPEENDNVVDRNAERKAEIRNQNLLTLDRFINIMEKHLRLNNNVVKTTSLENNADRNSNEEFKTSEETNGLTEDLFYESPKSGLNNVQKRAFVLPSDQRKEATDSVSQIKINSSKHLLNSLWHFILRPAFYRTPSFHEPTRQRMMSKRMWYFKRYRYFDDLASNLVG